MVSCSCPLKTTGREEKREEEKEKEKKELMQVTGNALCLKARWACEEAKGKQKCKAPLEVPL